MKYHLKNRPTCNNYEENSKVQLKAFYSFNERWFKGFEKELRDILKHDDVLLRLPPEELIEEILGDERSDSQTR